jgi:hypothetical protein
MDAQHPNWVEPNQDAWWGDPNVPGSGPHEAPGATPSFPAPQPWTGPGASMGPAGGGGLGWGGLGGGQGWGAPWMMGGGGGPFMALLQQLMGNMGGPHVGGGRDTRGDGGAVQGGPGWAALNPINNQQPLPAWAGGPPGGDVQPVGGGRNFSGPFQMQDPGFGGGGGGNRRYAGGSPWFNEMQPGNWMGSALRGGGGSTYPLNPSNSAFTGTQGSNYAPMASGPFPTMQRQNNSGPFPALY